MLSEILDSVCPYLLGLLSGRKVQEGIKGRSKRRYQTESEYQLYLSHVGSKPK